MFGISTLERNSMIGTSSEKDFSIDNYEGFYEHHHFQPIPEKLALSIHEHIPRFGWGLDKILDLKPKTVLDIGCLDGSFALTIASKTDAAVTGIDLTMDGIDLARQRADSANLDAAFFQGFAEDWLEKFAKEGKTFDVITFFEIIEHVEDVQRLLRLIDGVLAPGGTVLISTPDFEAPTFGKDDEQNKCHIRLYTTADADYTAINKYGTERTATSMTREVGKHRIKEMGVFNELINVEYQ